MCALHQVNQIVDKTGEGEFSIQTKAFPYEHRHIKEDRWEYVIYSLIYLSNWADSSLINEHDKTTVVGEVLSFLILNKSTDTGVTNVLQ